MSDRRYDDEHIARFSDEPTLAWAVEAMQLLGMLAYEIQFDAFDSGEEPLGSPRFCDCIRRRVYAAPGFFFEQGGYDASPAPGLARDAHQHRCHRHAQAGAPA